MRLRWLVHGVLASFLGAAVAGADVSTEDERGLLEERPSAVWRSVARRTAALPPVLSDAGEAALATWAQEVSAALGPEAARPIGTLLCSLPALDRTRLIAAWATSPDDALRLGLAHALAYPLYAVGIPTALEVLCDDADPAVRHAAFEASRLREHAATG